MTNSILDDLDDSFDTAADPTNAGGGDDFEIPLPPTVCGILRCHIADAKVNPKNKSTVLLDIKCEEPMFRDAVFTQWMDLTRTFNIQQLVALCNVLGVKASTQGGKLKIPGGLKALKGLAGLFVVSTYSRKDGSVSSSLAVGMPKAEKSEYWDEYAGTRNFTEAQIKVIKESKGVIPEEHHALFEGINAE